MAHSTESDKNFLHRLGDAVKAFRVQFSGTGTGGRSSYVPTLDQIFSIWNSASRRTSINFAQEVGDLTQSSLVMAVVNWVGRALPEAIARVMESDKEGKDSPVTDHPLAKILKRPNPYYSGSTMAKAIALNWALNGNAYIIKQRNALGQVIQLYSYPYWTVRPVRDDSTQLVSYYEVNVNGIWQRVDSAQDITGRDNPLANVIHLRDGIDPYNDMLGLSGLGCLLREIFTDNEAAYFGAVIMKNMGIIPYVVSPADKDTDIDAEKVKESLIRQTTGDRANEPAVINGSIRVDKLGMTPAEMALDALRNVPEERLAGVLGIPGMVVGFGSAWSRSTFSNFAQATEAAYENYMVPLWRYLDEEFTHQLLLRDFDLPETNRRVEHDLSKVRALQDDEDALYRRVGLAYQQGWITRGDARGKTGFKVDEERDNVFLNRVGNTFIPGDDPSAQFPEPISPARQITDGGAPLLADGKNPPSNRRSLPAHPQPPQLAAASANSATKDYRAGRSACAECNNLFLKGATDWNCGRHALPMEYSVKRVGKFKFSSTQIDLPPTVATAMSEFGAKIPNDQLGEDGREDEPHVTILYGLHTSNAADVEKVLAGESPVRLSFGPTSYFEGEEFDVVYVSVESEDLRALNQNVSDNLANTNTHPEYTPHATIAYVKPGLGREYANLDIFEGLYSDVSVVADTVTFSDRGAEKTSIRLNPARQRIA
jgi:HK97 family phage portal protein